MKSFEEWWSEFWKTNGLPGAMNMAFREISEKAWNAATEQAKIKHQIDVESKFHLTCSEFHD